MHGSDGSLGQCIYNHGVSHHNQVAFLFAFLFLFFVFEEKFFRMNGILIFSLVVTSVSESTLDKVARVHTGD